MIVKLIDVKSAGFCDRGLERWCQRNGLDYGQLRYGIHEDVLLGTGCVLARKVVRAAHERIDAEHRSGDDT